IPGHATMQDFLLRRALKQQGIAVNEIKLLVLKPPEMIPALSRKDIDAFIAWEPYPSKAVTENAGRILMTSHQIWAQHPCCVIVADEAFCGKHPEMVQKLKSVHRRAVEFINANRPKAIAIGVNYTGMDGKTVTAALGNITYGGVLERQYVAEYVDFLRELRYIRPDIAKDVLMSILPEQ
ncbi:MAG: ABC transporter substrate-binding protein, partial [Proteobacteria bacterium]|nr:ABC transporter substrate-binding protein [Pseudomonadota bacterium]